MKNWIIFAIAVVAFGLGFGYWSKQEQLDIANSKFTQQSESTHKKIELLEKQVVLLQKYAATMPEQHSHSHEVEKVEPKVMAEADDIVPNDPKSDAPYYDENGVLTYPSLEAQIPAEEGVCIDWVDGGECYLSADAHIPDLVFKPNGHTRPDRMQVVGNSKNFWESMQQTALKKTGTESFTRESELNKVISEAVAGEEGIGGGEFVCSDDLCGGVFTYDNWDHWMAFAESSPLLEGGEALGNMHIIGTLIDNGLGMEVRVMYTPNEYKTLDAY